MACEICSRLTHEWYDCPKKPDGYVPLARRERKESAGGVESRHASHIKGTGTPPDGMGPLGKDRHRIHQSGKTRPEPPKTDADKIAVASASFGPTDSSQAGVAPSPVDTDLTKRGTPRQRAPKGTFDRKEWQRKYQERLRKDRRDHPEKYGKPAKKGQP